MSEQECGLLGLVVSSVVSSIIGYTHYKFDRDDTYPYVLFAVPFIGTILAGILLIMGGLTMAMYLERNWRDLLPKFKDPS